MQLEKFINNRLAWFAVIYRHIVKQWFRMPLAPVLPTQ
jgi:hypothetical protein